MGKLNIFIVGVVCHVWAYIERIFQTENSSFLATTTRHSFIVYTYIPIYNTPLPLTFSNGKIKYNHCRSGVSCMGSYRKDFSTIELIIFGNYDLSFSRFDLHIFLFCRISIAQIMAFGVIL